MSRAGFTSVALATFLIVLSAGKLLPERQARRDHTAALVHLHSPTAAVEQITLRDLCDKTIWRPGLWLQCHTTNIMGGLNNARNRMQTCMRLAIDAGAGLVLPLIGLRDSNNLKALSNGTLVRPDVFFNIDSMRELAAELCPQLEIDSVAPYAPSVGMPAVKWYGK